MNENARTPEPRTEYGVRDAFGNVHLALDADEAAALAADNTRPLLGPQPRTVVQRTVTWTPWKPAEVKP